VAVFTNLTRDHLDYHRTMEKYFAAKRLLFDGTVYPAPRVAVINAHDPRSERLAEALGQGRGGGSHLWNRPRRLARGRYALTPGGAVLELETPAGSAK
jgi:UDP-N-acetylmuramoyl-L-alanyl-D-glutamate--2,6-diaminopimelate ligase